MTGADLLAACRADPEADAPRLVYADWLDESGAAERAELIRVQCRLARLPWDEFPESRELRRRASELVRSCGRAWASEGLPGGLETFGWERGFPETLVLHTPDAMSVARDAEAGPFVRLALRGVPRTGIGYQALAGSSLGPIRRALFDADTVHDGALNAFAESDWGRLARVVTFVDTSGAASRLVRRWADTGPVAASAWDISGGELSQETLEAFAALAAPLRSLRLHDVAAENAGLLGLFGCDRAAGLHELTLDVVEMDGLEPTLALRACPDLERLTVRGSALIQREFAETLALAPGPLALRSLRLENLFEVGEVLEAVGRSPRLTGLRHLAIVGCYARPEDWLTLADSDTLDPRLVLETDGPFPEAVAGRLGGRFELWDLELV